MDEGLRGRRVLVTGGSGFLGRAVCRRLGALDPAELCAPARGEYDLTRPEDVAKMFVDAQPDVVVHLAARVGGIGANVACPADLYVDNLLMGTYVIEEARRAAVAKTVIVGTICSYPKHTPVPFSEDALWDGYPEETNAPYGIAKKALLVHAQANRVQHGQNVVYLLPTNLYGPGDRFDPRVSHVIPALIKRFVDAKESDAPAVQVWGTGAATREFLFVDDAAEAIVLATERYDAPDPLNLGSGREIAVRDLAALIAGLVGYEGALDWDHSKPDGQPRRRVDSARAERVLGWRARTSLEDGLDRTIAWYLQHRDRAAAVAGG